MVGFRTSVRIGARVRVGGVISVRIGDFGSLTYTTVIRSLVNLYNGVIRTFGTSHFHEQH